MNSQTSNKNYKSLVSKKQNQVLAAKLAQAGLRCTAPRLALAHLLFGDDETKTRHVTAEQLYEEAQAAQVRVSLATVYNSLNQFRAAGLLREVVVAEAQSAYFDTNVSPHHHFYIEEETQNKKSQNKKPQTKKRVRLIDVPADAIKLSRLPEPPQGFTLDGAEVMLKLKSK